MSREINVLQTVGKEVSRLTEHEIVILGDGLEKPTVRTPIKLHQWLRATNLVALFVRKSIPRYSEEIDTTVLGSHGHDFSS